MAATLRGILVATVAAHVVTMGHATRGERAEDAATTSRRLRSIQNMQKASRIPYPVDLSPGKYPDVIGVLPLADTEKQEPIDSSVFSPGDFRGNLRSDDHSLRLSNGLQARVIATQGSAVTYANADQSDIPFHLQPNGGAVFAKENGGWIYVTNSRSSSPIGVGNDSGGVGALEFDMEGDLIGYQRLLSGTSNNRGGGKTPWETWITCEYWGCRQVDPTGNRDPEQTSLGIVHELGAFAYNQGSSIPQFFVTQSGGDGVLSRFTPDKAALNCYESDDKWCSLASGQHDFLVLYSDRTFAWSTNYDAARASEFEYFRDAAAITVDNSKLYIISKTLNQVVCLDLLSMSYTITSRAAELQPLVGDAAFYFPEGPNVFGKDSEDEYFILFYTDSMRMKETIGVVLSPNQKHMYVSYQESGLIFDIKRMDGEPFQGPFVDINYLTLV